MRFQFLPLFIILTSFQLHSQGPLEVTITEIKGGTNFTTTFRLHDEAKSVLDMSANSSNTVLIASALFAAAWAFGKYSSASENIKNCFSEWQVALGVIATVSWLIGTVSDSITLLGNMWSSSND